MATGALTFADIDIFVTDILRGGGIGEMRDVWNITYVEMTHVLVDVHRGIFPGRKTYTITSTLTFTVTFMNTVTGIDTSPLRGGAGIFFARPFDSAWAAVAPLMRVDIGRKFFLNAVFSRLGGGVAAG